MGLSPLSEVLESFLLVLSLPGWEWEGLGGLDKKFRSALWPQSVSYPLHGLYLVGVLGACDLGLTMSCHHLLKCCASSSVLLFTPHCTLLLFSDVLVRINEQKNLFLCLICCRAWVVNNP